MQSFHARILFKFLIPFKDIPERFLQYDTDSPELSAAEIREEIRALYRSDPPTDEMDMTVYLLEKLPNDVRHPGGNA